MARFLFIALFLVALSTPLLVEAQACSPTGPNTCAAGSVCKDITGTGRYFCTSDSTGCTPACKSNETCVDGKCVAPRAPTPTDHYGGTSGGPTGSGGTSGGSTGSGGTSGGPTGSGGTSGVVSPGLTNPLNNIDSLPELLAAVLAAIVRIGTIILTLALVYVGFLFVAAQGNEEKISNAKSALLWTVIGGLILLGASAIGAVIGSTVGKL